MGAAGTIVGHVLRCVGKQASVRSCGRACWGCDTGCGANTCLFVPLHQADTKVRLTAIFETTLKRRSFHWRAPRKIILALCPVRRNVINVVTRLPNVHKTCRKLHTLFLSRFLPSSSPNRPATKRKHLYYPHITPNAQVLS